MIMIGNFLFNFTNFRIIIVSLLTLGILFSTAVNTEVVAKLVILGISVLTSFIFVLRIVLVAKWLISGISSSILIFALYSGFLKTSFLTTLLNLLKSTGTGTNLLISNLSTSSFRLAKFVFNAKLEVST